MNRGRGKVKEWLLEYTTTVGDNHLSRVLDFDGSLVFWSKDRVVSEMVEDGYASIMAGAPGQSHRVSNGARQSSSIVDKLRRRQNTAAAAGAVAEFVTSSPLATSSRST